MGIGNEEVEVVQSPGDFAQQLRTLRQAQGLSMRGLAGLIGVSSVTVWKWEKGDSKPRARMIVPLARALDVPPRQLESSTKIDEKTDVSQNSDAASLERSAPGGESYVAGQNGDEGGSPIEPLADVIARAKQMIAEASGTGSNNITIRIEY